MPIYTEPDEPEFAALETKHGWFPAVLLHEYGEQQGASLDAETPPPLDWLQTLPMSRRYDFATAECGMAYQSLNDGYSCTIWDVTGEDDDPWAVFLVDDYGARFLPEYSILDEDASDEEREAVLRRAANDIPDRAIHGDFDRTGTPLTIPDWLREPRETDA